MPDPFTKPSKTKKIFKVLKVIFLSKFPMNLLFLILIISLSIYGLKYLKPTDSPTGNVILEQKCPECVCEEKECSQTLQEECEQDCSLCPIKTKIEKEEILRYKCPSGDVVDDLDDCTSSLPKVADKYSGTIEGITLSIDNIRIEEDEEDSGFVTRVDYTIINKADLPVVPKLEVKVYKDWSSKVKKEPSNKVIDPEIVVNSNDYAQRKDNVRIYFKGEEQTMRLLLVDTLPDPDVDLLAVTREFSLD